MSKKYKKIEVGCFRIDADDGIPYQTVNTAENGVGPSDMYFLERCEEPGIELDGFFTISTLEEICKALKEFDKRAKK